MKQLIILDRDGVINHDSDQYIKSPTEWIPIPGSLEAIARLNQAGFIVAIATNQSGVGRGLYSLQTLQAMHQKMRNLFADLGGHIDKIVFCPHLPSDNCECRKPKPGMYREIAVHFDLPLEDVPVIGDSARDLVAAQAVAARPLLVRTGKGERTLQQHPEWQQVPCFADLAQAVDFLLET